ncbi:MAG: phosphonoacetaldehyde hydrolase [Nanoarchaeota archaeon]|nr:phosphonoacetaldehyde hydrolase [Nanoarchaeota archaeon]
MTEQRKLQAIILDWAGTTLDYGCYAPAVVFQQVFEEKGVPITMAEAREPMGAHKKVHIRKITKNPAVQERWEGTYGRLPNENDVKEMFASFVPKQLACLADYADLIPGTLEALAQFREQGLKIGSTTGYTGEMMQLLLKEANQRGYAPDVTVCSTGDYAVRRGDNYEWGQVQGIGEGWNISRPAPHMCNLNMMLLGVSEPSLCVKVDDTLLGIEEGRKAGMWTMGLAQTGNELGLNEKEIAQLSHPELTLRLKETYRRMYGAGADYVVAGIGDVPAVVEKINADLAKGRLPYRSLSLA